MDFSFLTCKMVVVLSSHYDSYKDLMNLGVGNNQPKNLSAH
jgi:hypothetical protein